MSGGDTAHRNGKKDEGLNANSSSLKVDNKSTFNPLVFESSLEVRSSAFGSSQLTLKSR